MTWRPNWLGWLIALGLAGAALSHWSLALLVGVSMLAGAVLQEASRQRQHAERPLFVSDVLEARGADDAAGPR